MALESSLASDDTAGADTPGVNQEQHEERLAYDARIAALRDVEYPMLKDQVYLDHAGTTLPSSSLLSAFATDLATNLYGNPHSFASASSQRSSTRIDNARLKVLHLFNADPAQYDVVFVANATAGIKLVAEAFASQNGGFEYWYHKDSHTSLVGVRELANKSMCLESDAAVEEWLSAATSQVADDRSRLFAYPAQSNMDGRRLPLTWSKRSDVSSPGHYTLLDAAGLVSTSILDLTDCAPDFTIMSFYKMFGFPDLGALIVRKDAGHIFQTRKYFGGGTVETVSCDSDQQWHFKKNILIHDGLEDGSLPIHNIIALDLAIDKHEQLFGSFASISKHTRFLASTLHAELKGLAHGNGMSVCEIYNGTGHEWLDGPVLAFNLVDSSGAYISHQEVLKLTNVKNMHLRTGNLCNPGGVSRVLNMNAKDLLDNYSAGVRCGSEQDIIHGRPTGVIRVSFGAMSILQDAHDFVAFLKEYFVEGLILEQTQNVSHRTQVRNQFYIQQLVVYPIKSCGGYTIPHDTPWNIHSQGLAWDREWCLIHQGTRTALSQKRYHRLALFRPHLDLQRGILNVQWTGSPSMLISSSISIPLSMNAIYGQELTARTCPTNLCGNNIEPLIYQSKEITDFFSVHLDVPVYLARLPRTGLSDLIDHASYPGTLTTQQQIPGSFPTPPPSPREFVVDEQKSSPTPLSLANESPILVVFQQSLDVVNSLLPPEAEQIPPHTFRANIVLNSAEKSDPSPSSLPLKLVEDELSALVFHKAETSRPQSTARLKLLAPCRRCQMIALDQSTGLRRPHVFTHMAKIRRSNGGVWFGVHAALESAGSKTRIRTIKVGDALTGD